MALWRCTCDAVISFAGDKAMKKAGCARCSLSVVSRLIFELKALAAGAGACADATKARKCFCPLTTQCETAATRCKHRCVCSHVQYPLASAKAANSYAFRTACCSDCVLFCQCKSLEIMLPDSLQLLLCLAQHAFDHLNRHLLSHLRSLDLGSHGHRLQVAKRPNLRSDVHAMATSAKVCSLYGSAGP